MNDRFKFRAWNTQTKIMKEVSQLSFDKKQVAEYAPSDKVLIHLIFQPHFILMQCTGEKDKYNKLIFSGDIVKQGDSIYVVELSIGGFRCREIRTKYLYHFFVLSSEHCEVIGNIYENPELLEGVEV